MTRTVSFAYGQRVEHKEHGWGTVVEPEDKSESALMVEFDDKTVEPKYIGGFNGLATWDFVGV